LMAEPHLSAIFLDVAQITATKKIRDQRPKSNLGHQDKIIASILQKLQQEVSIATKIRLTNHLSKYEPQHPLVLESLLYCLQNCHQKAYLKQVGELLRSLVSIEQFPIVLPLIRDIYLQSPEHNIEQHHESYRILWYWSRSITYQEFEQLWLT
jgi:hypothetical protein